MYQISNSPRPNYQQAATVHEPTKAPLNKSYLIKMKRKHKNKINANVAGTKFDLSMRKMKKKLINYLILVLIDYSII